ncbi:hypothetical protein Syun_023398 [Stephania yunnanensis]|uniref:Uncharacterized protein n=1 Tax=Stephania yunnanensis TaxID=152371 RepID=A0AAP0FI43_9MAGN
MQRGERRDARRPATRETQREEARCRTTSEEARCRTTSEEARCRTTSESARCKGRRCDAADDDRGDAGRPGDEHREETRGLGKGRTRKGTTSDDDNEVEAR